MPSAARASSSSLSIVATILFVFALVWRLPIDGLCGAGFAYLAMASVTALMSVGWAMQSLSGKSNQSTGPKEAQPSVFKTPM
jgi:hypothetical protein